MNRTMGAVLALLLLVALLLAGCGGSSGGAAQPGAKTDAQSSAVAAGKTKFVQSCAACHGPEGKGVTGLGKDFTSSEFVRSQTDDQLVAFIKKGRPANDPANTTKVEMPAKGGNPSLTDTDLSAIVAYIRTLHK